MKGKIKAVIAALFLLGSAPLYAASETYDAENIILTAGTARGITASKLAQPTMSDAPCAAFLTVAGSGIHFRVDGGVATSTTGHIVAAGGNFTLDSWQDMRNLSMAADLAAGATVFASLARGCGTVIKK